jgi:phenylacetate-CoA ligase
MNPFLQKELKDVNVFLNELCNNDSSYWEKRGENMALKLFKEMSVRVPAYKKFLKENKINPNKIKTFKDTLSVPPIDKESYLKKYELKDLCWDGVFDKSSWVISSTSGSTGEPFYFPRNDEQDLLYSLTAELYLITNFDIQKKSTLYIDAFPMGPWIGGLFTYQAIKHIASRGKYNLSIITTSINKNEIIKTVKKFGPMFDQIIIGSYGPFLKDTLEDGLNQGVNWKDYDIKFVFSAEGFSENFRDYVLETSGHPGCFERTLNHYGTVDLGTMAHETPAAIAIRRSLLENPDIYKDFFNQNKKVPTLCQYIPEHFYFQKSDNGNGLLCSSYSGLPLFKYDLKDNGGIVSYDKVINFLNENKLNAKGIIHNKHVPKKSLWKLPFVYIFERSDFSVSFYAFQVYPDTIRKAIQINEMEHKITGKFTMQVDYDQKNNQKLSIHIELSANESPSDKLKNLLLKLITDLLILENSEYCKTYKEKGELIHPEIIFHKYEDPLYFKAGIKQKWVK